MSPRTLIAALLASITLGSADTFIPAALALADQASEVLQQAQQALGGDKLASVQALSLEGPFTRGMGGRQLEGTTVLTLAQPDRLHRSEDTELPGGASMERIVAIAGDVSWDDVQNRGGMGGGMQIMTFRGPGGQPMNEEAMAEARTRRLKAERQRWMLSLLLRCDEAPSYAGVAESADGKADVLELKDERGQPVRLFLDQATHLPLMLSFLEIRPRMMTAGPGGRRGGPGGPGPGAGGPPPDREEMRRRLEAEGPPKPSTVTMYLADYRRVDGIMVPHRITQSVDGQPADEWTIEKVKVNPSLKADLFEKKSQ